jgi:acyl-CoA synthetase (AMP-forming)/AMP-acid ligase II/acyl carrier protein
MDVSEDTPRNLTDILVRASRYAPQLGIGYLEENGSATLQTYPELVAAAARLLTGLRARGLVPGDPVIVALSRNQNFLTAFWACVLGGLIPVPVAPPEAAHKPRQAMERLQNVWRVLQRPWVLTDGDLPPEIERHVAISTIADEPPAVNFHRAGLDDTAFIQFSSGSTSAPKGVVLTHRNVLSNLVAITEGLQLNASDTTLNWLPLHHDMGLVGFHLTLVHCAVQQYHIEPDGMVKHPLLWLDGLERFRCTVTGTPNFGLALVLARVERAAGRTWDLSSVRLILVGAEPISVDTLERFTARLQPFGLNPRALFPVYGLAEATVAVAFPPLGRAPQIETLQRDAFQADGRAVPAASDDPSPIRFAVEGFALRGCEIRIVDEQDQQVADGSVGHIQIRGENVTAGYYDAPDLNLEAFAGPWLRTGDLGFVRDRQLSVTGRRKDIIFLNGQNYYAHDLEAMAQQVSGATRKVVVCGWHDPRAGREQLLLFLSGGTGASAASLFVDVNRHLQRTVGITVDVAIPLASKEFPRTTSGKLQRYRLRERFERGEFASDIAEMRGMIVALLADVRRQQPKEAPRTATERLLHRIWCDELQLDPAALGINDRFDEAGGQSIQALAILMRVEKELGTSIHSQVLAAHPTIAEQAAFLDRHAASLQVAPGHKPQFFRG